MISVFLNCKQAFKVIIQIYHDISVKTENATVEYVNAHWHSEEAGAYPDAM